jgi:hypothetical protein
VLSPPLCKHETEPGTWDNTSACASSQVRLLIDDRMSEPVEIFLVQLDHVIVRQRTSTSSP